MPKIPKGHPYPQIISRTLLFENCHWKNRTFTRLGSFHSIIHVFDVGKIHCRPGGSLPLQRLHSQNWAFHLVREGRGFFLQDKHKFQFKEGDLVILPPSPGLFQFMIETASVQIYRFELFDSVGIRSFCLREVSGQYVFHPASPDLLQAHFERLFLLLETQDERVMQRIPVEVFAFISEAGRQCFHPNVPDTIKALQTEISSFPCEDYSIADLAAVCGMSLRTFQRHFKKEVGCCPLSFVLIGRLNIARRLLQTTALSISDVAEYCRFKSLSHFTRTFKKYTGVTPREFQTMRNSADQYPMSAAMMSGMNSMKKSGINNFSERKKQILWLIFENIHITVRQLSEKLGINPSAVQKHILSLKKKQLLVRKGSPRNGYWQIQTSLHSKAEAKT